GPYIRNETGRGTTCERGRMAGAEGFEPSALGFGDRCSDQTELRPYAPTGFYPPPPRPRLASSSWPSSSPAWARTHPTRPAPPCPPPAPSRPSPSLRLSPG